MKMANKNGKKGKKPIQTTLGKAADQGDKEVDLSHVRKPIHTSIFGLDQVLSLFHTATEEVQNYIKNECDVMYECRICRTIFRSLANFILHKRNYCRDRYDSLSTFQDNEGIQGGLAVQPEEKPPDLKENTDESSNKGETGLTAVIQKLKDKHDIEELTQHLMSADLSKATENEEILVKKNANNDVLLQKINTNNAAVYQTALESTPLGHTKLEHMKQEMMEIHNILDNDEAVLGPDGQRWSFGAQSTKKPGSARNDFTCRECNKRFSTVKTLSYHVGLKHNKSRLVYVCPDCRETYANAWCVYRHLLKVHHRSNAQIRRMRDQIYNNVVRKDQEPQKKKDRKEVNSMDKTDEENQWLNNIEGDKDFQMCGGCGKRFERKAALHSHAQMCTKRIALCNTIKGNNAKKKEEESKGKTNKADKPSDAEVPKGAAKRKPYLLRHYNTPVEISYEEGTGNICDVNANSEIRNETCDIISNVIRDNAILSRDSPDTFLDSKEEMNSSDNLMSPSIEKIDKERMLSIIGINSDYSTMKIPNVEHGVKKEVVENTCETGESALGNVSLFDKLLQHMGRADETVRQQTPVCNEEEMVEEKNSIETRGISQQKDKFDEIMQETDVVENRLGSQWDHKDIEATLEIDVEENISLPEEVSPRYYGADKTMSQEVQQTTDEAEIIQDKISNESRTTTQQIDKSDKIVQETGVMENLLGGAQWDHTDIEATLKIDVEENISLFEKVSRQYYGADKKVSQKVQQTTEEAEIIKEKISIENRTTAQQNDKSNETMPEKDVENRLRPPWDDEDIELTLEMDVVKNRMTLPQDDKDIEVILEKDVAENRMSSPRDDKGIEVVLEKDLAENKMTPPQFEKDSEIVLERNIAENKLIFPRGDKELEIILEKDLETVQTTLPRISKEVETMLGKCVNATSKPIFSASTCTLIPSLSELSYRGFEELCEKSVPFTDNESMSAKNDEIEIKSLTSTLELTVSPRMREKSKRNPGKRKRVKSFDFSQKAKTRRVVDMESVIEGQDVNFIGKAAPYMDQDKLLCVPCQISFNTLPKLLWHMSAHFSWFQFQCSRCSFISFSKSDCALHARKSHNANHSVVLRIPNWKTVLMSHDFIELVEENNFSGKHTDEVMVCGEDERIMIEGDVEKEERPRNDDLGIENVNTLFSDPNTFEVVSDEGEGLCEPVIKEVHSLQNGNTDIVDKSEECFVVNVPQEIYSLDDYEVISILDSCEDNNINKVDRQINSEHMKEVSKVDRLINSEHMKEVIENNFESEIAAGTVTYEQDNDMEAFDNAEADIVELVNLQNVEIVKDVDSEPTSPVEPVKNIRPTRNRTKSVKTLQKDFVYDLNKALKLNDFSSSGIKGSNVSRQRKTVNSSSQKTRSTASASAKGIKVYPKKE